MPPCVSPQRGAAALLSAHAKSAISLLNCLRDCTVFEAIHVDEFYSAENALIEDPCSQWFSGLQKHGPVDEYVYLRVFVLLAHAPISSLLMHQCESPSPLPPIES